MTTFALPGAAPARARIDQQRVADLYRQLLTELGEDPDRNGLTGTPERVARWWAEFLEYAPGRTDTVFAHESAIVGGDELVLVSGIVVDSLCEHHLQPMTLTVSAGYRPGGQVIGLSKIARIAVAHGHRLQLQERIVNGIAADLLKATGSADVAVAARGGHACMSARGIRATGAVTTSYSLHGAFAQAGPPTDWLRATVLGASR
ncbi:GTP cyclohydrolase I [Streptomyces katsurahamanus]|uniref:GTP cyclohydrolase 1 n=1 Tax=Streptomyces katsurahamanus TaxID=2577098 RepID=A0ABW9NYK2_9ACTN|nr:GTP cyclohydrolase I [Streptomyces katsurahamanus]MQS38308.1 GTP cyclohydrolase I FolE [Streptomyces katsurahamanus]